jgi:hypothetical protein
MTAVLCIAMVVSLRIAVNRTGMAEQCAKDIESAVRAEAMKPSAVFETVSSFFKTK